MQVMINQPCPFATLYLWNRMAVSDVVIFLNSAQLIRRQAKGSRAYPNAYEILVSGRRHKLTVPTRHTGTQKLTIADAKIDYSTKWVKQHVKTVQMAYARKPYFKEVFPLYESIMSREYESLSGFSMATIVQVAEFMGVTTRFVEDEELCPKDEDPSRWMLNLVVTAKGDRYLCGQWAVDTYIRTPDFRDQGVEVIGQDWRCPEYEQGGRFESNLSVLDLLFSLGPREALKIVSPERLFCPDCSTD